MSLRDQVLRVLQRGEVDQIDKGRDHIASIQEREQQRAAQSAALRAHPTKHPEVQHAARKRLRLIK